MPRLAIIGCGAVVELRMIDALRRIGWLPKVLVDISPQRLEAVARKMGRRGARVKKASRWESVADEFDAAIITLPNFLHASIGAALAKAGKHLFIEKPLAITGDECRAVISAAERSGVTLLVGLIRRYLHVARWTKALLEAGILGEIKRFEAHEGGLYGWDMGSGAPLQLKMSGGGVLIDTGAHTVDLLLWWFGDLELVEYRDDSQGGVEADCELECRFGANATGKLELSRTRMLSNSIRIEGTQGFIEVHLQENKVIAGSPNALAFKHDGVSAFDMPPQPHRFDAELKDFRTSASGGGLVGVMGREGTKSVELIERCYRARKPLSQAWVQVSPDTAQGAENPLAKLSPKSKVLVTGATGFIGGRLVERLFRETDVSVRCLVRNLGSATRLARLPVEIVRADLADPSDIDRAVQGVNYVFHCAYDRLSREQNVEGLRNLVAACATHKVRRLVYVSSYAVYEQVPDGPVTEETPEGDRSVPYVGAKLELEQMVLNMAGPLKVPATVVQPTIVYGPFCGTWTNDPAEKLIYGTVVLPDRGDGVCNAVYVDDVVDGLVLAALSSDAVGGRFILSGPHPITWATYFTEFARALKTNPPHHWPREQISKESRGIIPEIRRGLSDPRHIVTLLRRWEPVRQAMNAAVAAMPGTWQTHLRGYYKDGRLGETFLPPPELLAFYCLKGTAGIEKAHSILGYKPRFEFQTGMAPTGEYLRWAFGDLSRSVAARRAEAALKAHPRDVTGG